MRPFADAVAKQFIAAFAFTLAIGACSDKPSPVGGAEELTSPATPAYTMSSGAVSSLIARSTVAEGFKVKRKTGTWELDLQAKDPIDVVVATLTIQPGGNIGWHTHPGPGFVQVASGTAHFYEAGDASCTPTVVTPGHAWLDRGETTHIARNESGSPLTLVVTLMIPPGSQPRIDEPAPGNCPF